MKETDKKEQFQQLLRTKLPKVETVSGRGMEEI
jgi:hypothetical protein